MIFLDWNNEIIDQDYQKPAVQAFSLGAQKGSEDGGYNSTNINKQLLPVQNTPALTSPALQDYQFIIPHHTLERKIEN